MSIKKMNPTTLYTSVCRVVMQADINDLTSLHDLYILFPYLRQSLCCTVCGNLLIEPQTPQTSTEPPCQHHVCRKCKGGRKKLKPICILCTDYDNHVENRQLRIVLQCYKQLCQYIMMTELYACLSPSPDTSGNGVSMGTSSLLEFIQEGAGYEDEYVSNGGLSRSAYSILPCVYTSTSTQTHTAVGVPIVTESSSSNTETVNPVRTVSNGSALYSVMYAGNGTNKLTIRRKNSEQETEVEENVAACSSNLPTVAVNPAGFKKPPSQKLSSKNNGGNSVNKRKGCRCGNATATPGKLTCCGQRCPCYVDSKACIDCRCRGCRNPHRPGGHKVRPMIPELENFHIQLENDARTSSSMSVSALSTSNISTSNLDWLVAAEHDPQLRHSLEAVESFATQSSLGMTGETLGDSIQVLGVYTTQLQHIPSALPAALLMGESSNDDSNSDVEVDI